MGRKAGLVQIGVTALGGLRPRQDANATPDLPKRWTEWLGLRLASWRSEGCRVPFGADRSSHLIDPPPQSPPQWGGSLPSCHLTWPRFEPCRKAASITGRPGFTLTELLVVMAIIAALAGLIAPALFYARRRVDKDLTRQEIVRLTLGIEGFADQDRFGSWPPATLERLGLEGTNGINEGNESLVICLSAQRDEGPYFEFELDRLTNLDGDTGPESILQEGFRSALPGNDLREYVDPWGNPYVYFPSDSYGEKAVYVDLDGLEFEASVMRDPETGTFPVRLGFAIWSCGPDGLNENGRGDDITSWGR